MPKEIERKFLLKNDSWRTGAVSRSLLCQAYARFQGDTHRLLRVRLTDDQAFLTLKGPACGCTRSEFEYPIPHRDAEEILKIFCGPGQIEKYRYRVPSGRHVWEVDEFLGANAGLVLAEIELNAPDESFDLPDWIGREVTGEVRFYNARLLEHPYREWNGDERK